MNIEKISDLRRAMRQGPYVWPGGYTVYFITSDGAILSREAVKAELHQVIWSVANKVNDGWRVVAADYNEEDNDLTCDHTGATIA